MRCNTPGSPHPLPTVARGFIPLEGHERVARCAPRTVARAPVTLTGAPRSVRGAPARAGRASHALARPPGEGARGVSEGAGELQAMGSLRGSERGRAGAQPLGSGPRTTGQGSAHLVIRFGGDVPIDRSGDHHGLMAQPARHDEQGHPIGQQPSGMGVPQVMGSRALAEPSLDGTGQGGRPAAPTRAVVLPVLPRGGVQEHMLLRSATGDLGSHKCSRVVVQGDGALAGLRLRVTRSGRLASLRATDGLAHGEGGPSPRWRSPTRSPQSSPGA